MKTIYNKWVHNKVKIIFSSFIILLIFNCKVVEAQNSSPTHILLDRNWKFFQGDKKNAQNVEFNDSDWKIVQLPHDASISGSFVMDTLGGTKKNGFRPRHIGWYRKAFYVPSFNNKIVNIEFEGVYRDVQVWVNGKYLGRHLNGYTGFSYDLSQYADSGKPNIIAVRYDNTYTESSRWYTGEGIYRSVWLRITNRLHIAEQGVSVSTPFVTQSLANVKVETEVINNTDSLVLTEVQTIVYSRDGLIVNRALNRVPLKMGERYVFTQNLSVLNPVFWDNSHPNLYTVQSIVLNGKEKTDECQTHLGIRTVEFTPDQGFLLNGRKLFLKGVNIHHELGPLGAASFEKGIRRRILELKKIGCNAIRLAHNPHASALLDMCDELGILVFDEAFDKWDNEYYGPGESFADHWQNDLSSFIKRDRNHPSVFIWSVGNEVFNRTTKNDTFFVAQLKRMVSFAHELDPSRKVTCALYPARDKGPNAMAFYMDVVSDNYMSEFYKHDHEKYPQFVMLQSETSMRGGGTDYFMYDHSYSCGQFYWGGTDYLGESFGWPSKGWKYGILDWCDFWKPVAFYIKTLYTDDPLVKIAVFNEKELESRSWNDVNQNVQPMHSSWNWKLNQQLQLYTFTTGDEVELFINNHSAGTKKNCEFPTKKILWNVRFEPGTIKAVARKSGKVIAVDEIKTAGLPYKVSMEADSLLLHADGNDLAYITVKVLDKTGNLVPYAENSVSFKVEGEADIQGVGNGNTSAEDPFVTDKVKVFEGKGLVVLRSRLKSGKVKITATASGLKSSVMTLMSINK